MPTERQLPRYISHKLVWALKIASIVHLANPDPSGQTSAASYGAKIVPADPGYDAFDVSPEFVMRHQPQPGGYIVTYEDGYTSFSPAEPFERGCTAVAGPRVIDPGHRYRLDGAQVLQFLKKERKPIPPGVDGDGTEHEGGSVLVTTALGTSNEQLIEILIDRTEYLNKAVQAPENATALAHLKAALQAFEQRTARRMQAGTEGTGQA